MIKLQYWNGQQWVDAGDFYNEGMAWASLGSDNKNYRTITESGEVLSYNGKSLVK
jgi:hypothetical protein